MNTNCPFCNIDNQSLAFAFTAHFKAIYNLSPILPGHCLVIPSKHITSLFDLNEEEINTFFSFSRKVTAFLCEVYQCDAYDWSLQEGAEAGQSIAHLHLHIIPRKSGDLEEGENWYGKLRLSVDPDQKARIVLPDKEYMEVTYRLKHLWK
ncbi:MAG: HIT family protein [Bacteroidota bacterium]